MGSGPGKAVLERPGVGQTPGGRRKRPRIHRLHADRGTMGPCERLLTAPVSGPCGLMCHGCCWISPTTDVCKTRSRLTGCVKTGGGQVQPHVVTLTWDSLPLSDGMGPRAQHPA